MRRFVFRSPRLGFLAVGPALARPAAAFTAATGRPSPPLTRCSRRTSSPRRGRPSAWQRSWAGRRWGGASASCWYSPGTRAKSSGRWASTRSSGEPSSPASCPTKSTPPSGGGATAPRPSGTAPAGPSGCWGSTGRRPTSCPQRRLPAGGGEGGLPAGGAGPALSQHQRRVGGSIHMVKLNEEEFHA